jgi:hypothetical protein
MDIFATEYPISKEKSEGEGYFLNKDGTFNAFINHGCHGDSVDGTYKIENNIITFQNNLLNYRENNNKHIFEFKIENLDEKKRIFNGKEMIEYSQILKFDRDLWFIFSEDNSSPETHKRMGFRELFYYINPIEIPCDSNAEYLRLKINEFRKYFKLEELSNENLEKLILFNIEKKFKKACLFVFDLENIGITDNLFCAFYFYGKPFTIIEVKKNEERTLFKTYLSNFIDFSIDNDEEEPEKIINYEEEYSDEEFDFIMNFNPDNFNLEELQIRRNISSYFYSFKNENFDKTNISNLIELTKNEPYNGIVLSDNEDRQFVIYPNLWYVIFDKKNNTHKVYDFFGRTESKTKLEEIYLMRSNGVKKTILGMIANLGINNEINVIESGYLNN